MGWWIPSTFPEIEKEKSCQLKERTWVNLQQAPWTLKDGKSFRACICLQKRLQFVFKWWQVMHGWKSETSLSCSVIHRKIIYTFHKRYCTSVLLKRGFQTLLGHKPVFREEREKKSLALFYFSPVPVKCVFLQSCSWPLLQRLGTQSPRNKIIKLNASEV